MKRLIIFILLCFSVLIADAKAQRDITPTDSVTVTGDIDTTLTFKISDLINLPVKEISDIPISNHLGEIKYTYKNVKVVSLKDILSKIEFESGKPKTLSEYYFIFKASDDYKVTYSWNEIFNSDTGNNLYIIIEHDGLTINEMPERIASLTPTDNMTGRRFVKGLSQIIVKKADQ